MVSILQYALFNCDIQALMTSKNRVKRHTYVIFPLGPMSFWATHGLKWHTWDQILHPLFAVWPLKV